MDELAQAIVMVAIWCDSRRSSCDQCCRSGGASLLIYFKNDLGAHAWPNHDIDLKKRQKSRNTSVMSNVVAIDYIALSRDEISDMSGQFSDPNSERAYSSVERRGRVAVDI